MSNDSSPIKCTEANEFGFALLPPPSNTKSTIKVYQKMEEQFREICGQQRDLLVAGKAHADKVEAENAEQKTLITGMCTVIDDKNKLIKEQHDMIVEQAARIANMLVDYNDLFNYASRGREAAVDSD